jgi:hypothetical protein
MKSLKMLICTAVCVMALTQAGCLFPTPAYSAHERQQMVNRNMDYEWRQAQDDMDHLLLLRPASHMTIWNVN